MARPPYLLLALAFLAAVFFFASGHRLVDVDEGYYLLAAKLVADGKTPYLDFFYPQMPLLPYAYGGWMKLFGVSWHSARFLSALLAIALGMMLYFHLSQTTRKRSLGLLGVVLFAFSSFSLGWFTAVKTYALSTLLVFCSYLLLRSSVTSSKRYWWSGLFLGLAVDTRLLLVGLVPAVVAQIFWLEKHSGNRVLRWGWWLGGFLGALSVNGFFGAAPHNFFFNNIGYHLLRSDYGLVETLKQKLATALKLVGIGATEPIFAFQFVLLAVSSLFLLIRFRGSRKNLFLPAFFGGLLLLFSFLPSPAYLQYFSVLLPFLIVVTVTGLNNRWADWFSPKEKRGSPSKLLLLAAILAYLAGGMADGHRYAFRGDNVPGVETSLNVGNWKIEVIQNISKLINASAAGAGETVISWWPGYFVESEAAILPGMENNFGLAVAPKLTPEQRSNYRIVSREEIERIIRERRIGLVVLDNRLCKLPEFNERHRLLVENGFELVEGMETTFLYKRKNNI